MLKNIQIRGAANPSKTEPTTKIIKRRAALTWISVLGLFLVVVGAGALGLYYYTLPPATSGTPVSSTSTTQTVAQSTTVGQGGREYITVQFNGSSYQLYLKMPNSPTYSCPLGTAPAVCTLLSESCGNGISGPSEPWKNCYNCAYDDGCAAQQTCDLYTHQCTACPSVLPGFGLGALCG